MSNKVEPMDALVKTLGRCCALYNQLENENTRLRKLESPDPPTGLCNRRVDGEWQTLTADDAVHHDNAKIIEQAFVFHEVEQHFLAAIKDTTKAIVHPGLASAIDAKWLAELLGEINRLQVAALQINTITPEDRIAALTTVMRRLNHLQCSQAIPVRLTPAGSEQGTSPPKPNDDVGHVDRVAEAIAIMVRDPALTVDEIATKVGLNRTTLYKDRRFRDSRKTLKVIKSNSPQRRRDQLPRGEKDADGQIEAWSG